MFRNLHFLTCKLLNQLNHLLKTPLPASHSNFVLRSRKKTQWTFLQDNIILLQDNIFILRSWKKTSNISSSGQKRVWLSFETTSFCRRRKKIDKKILHPSVSQSSHDLLGNKSPLSHFSSVHHISSRTPFHFPRTLSFKITLLCESFLSWVRYMILVAWNWQNFG